VTRIICALFATSALAVAGCGSSDNKGSGSGYSAPAADQTTSSASTGGGTVAIDMKNIAFEPKQVTVKVGQTVKWENYDTVDHNVTATAGEEFKSDNFGKGGEYSYKVDKAGTIKYVCTLHPGMEGTVTVTQ
jgi:plastocyanin